jgi:hypothetical protein
MVSVEEPCQEHIGQTAELQHYIQDLSLEDLEALHSWVEDVIKERKINKALEQITLKKGREIIETRRAGKVTYQLEKVKCGKKKCKCNKGKLHGPYWYAYSWNGKKLASTYIGKTLETKKLSNDEG